MQTEAFVLVNNGSAKEAFKFQHITLSPLEEGEVLIASEAFGLNYADVMARLGLYREAPPKPCVLGYELVGRVIQIGAAVDPALLGERVLAFSHFGAYARHAKTTSNAIVPIGEMSAQSALPFATQGVTAHYMAEVLSPIQAHDKVLIHAAGGGVGSFLIQLAKNKGATVVAKIGSDLKANYVRSLGVDVVVNYNNESYETVVASSFGPNGLTASFNAVGGIAAKKDIKLLGPGGRLFLFGGADLATRKGIIGKLSFLWEMGFILPIGLMMQSKNLLGVNMLKIAESQPEVIQNSMKAMLRLYRDGAIKLPNVSCYQMGQFFEAHEALGLGQTMGKVVVFWD